MSVIVRGFERGDAKQVVELHARFNIWFEELSIDEEFILAATLRPDFRVYVADEDGVILGFTGILYYEQVGRAEVGPICVTDEYQKKGVGSLLVEKAISFLKDAGIHRVVVKVKSGNNTAECFFKKQGFKIEAVLENYTRKGEDAVQMARIIKDI